MVNIHSHQPDSGRYPTLWNIPFEDAETFFSSQTQTTVSVGIHPWHADKVNKEKFISLERWITDTRCIAIGECGLDKNSSASREQQHAVFKKQIELSEHSNKPMIIHCVGCFNELFALKKELNPSQLWIIHGFRGKPELANQIQKSGCAISYGEKFNPESVKATSFDKLFLETDESLLKITEIYQKIADIKNCRPNELIAGQQFLSTFFPSFQQ